MSGASVGMNSRTSGDSRKLPILAVLATAILTACLPTVIMQVFFVTQGHSTNDRIVFIISPTAYVVLLLMISIPLIRRRPALAPFDCVWLRWTRGEFIRFWLMPLGVVASAAIIALGAYEFGWPVRGRGVSIGSSDAPWHATIHVWNTMLAVFLAPCAEEIFWRGYVQSALARVTHPVLAVVGQAVLFGLVHFRPLLGRTEASLFGMVFGLWCWRRKTLVPVIIMHMAINGVVQVRE